MKKTRYIPYGYTVRSGRTVIDRNEADIIREIFESYINGSSLRDIAEALTARKVPYTEKTDIWDKARISRIIENAKYIGDTEYEPIIDGKIYKDAVLMKTARKPYSAITECDGIAVLRTRVKCAKCNAPMTRHIHNRDKVKESWICQNPECGCSVRIPDGQLLEKITVLLNRIILNSELIQPTKRHKCEDSYTVKQLQNEVDQELTREYPSEEYIIDRIGMMASQMYQESQSKDAIIAQLTRRRVELMKPQENFNSGYFEDIVAYITIDEDKRIILHTKTAVEIEEGVITNGSEKNPKTDGNSH